MRFLVDAQLPPALARWLCEMGHDATHVIDFGLQSATDRQIWNHTLSVDAVIVTKDEDFPQRRAMVERSPRIVWIRLPNARRRDLLAWFDKALPGILSALEAGETLVEVVWLLDRMNPLNSAGSNACTPHRAGQGAFHKTSLGRRHPRRRPGGFSAMRSVRPAACRVTPSPAGRKSVRRSLPS